MKYVILGCGPAGAFTAKNLRTLVPDAEITLVDAGTHGLYARMRLPEFLSGSLPAEKLILSSKEAFEKLSIECCFGAAVKSIDRSGRKILFEDGKACSYDILILATGADAFVPEVNGVGSVPHYVLRSLEDAEAIRCCAEKGLPYGALVIGGGLLGLEAAASLAKMSVPVTVAEFADRLLAKSLTETQSGVLKDKLQDMGMKFLLGCSLKSVVRNPDDNSLQCEFSNGEVLQTSLLLFSAGIRPRTALAAEAGLEVGRGIKVDQHLRTGDERIYAAGDCAEFSGGVIPGLWLAARDQAMALSGILAGKQSEFTLAEYHPEPKIAGIAMKEIRSV